MPHFRRAPAAVVQPQFIVPCPLSPGCISSSTRSGLSFRFVCISKFVCVRSYLKVFLYWYECNTAPANRVYFSQ